MKGLEGNKKERKKPPYGHIFALEASVICNHEWKNNKQGADWCLWYY